MEKNPIQLKPAKGYKQQRCKVQDSSNKKNDNNKNPFHQEYEEIQAKQKQQFDELKYDSQGNLQVSNDYGFLIVKKCVPLNIPQDHRFYLFTDVIFDTKFLRKVVKNKHLEYLQKNATKSVYKYMKFISHIEKKNFDRCTEIVVEQFSQPCDITDIVRFMKSMQNQRVNEIAEEYYNLWKLHNRYKQLVRNDNASYLIIEQENKNEQLKNPKKEFLDIRKERELSSQSNFTELINQLDKEKYIMYFYFKIDYHNAILENVRVGYTPALCQLLGGTEEIFHQRLLQRDFYEPFTRQFRLLENLDLMRDYFENSCQSQGENSIFPITTLEMDIFTVRGTFLKAQAFIKRMNVQSFYDTFKPLNFQTGDMLTVFELDIPIGNLEEFLELEKAKPVYFIKSLIKQEQGADIDDQDSEFDSDNEYFKNIVEDPKGDEQKKQEEKESTENLRNRNEENKDEDADKGRDYSEKQNEKNNPVQCDSSLGESSGQSGKVVKEEQW